MEIDKFIGRSDRYAIQTSNGHYVCVDKPMTAQDLKDHVKGTKTLATYVLDDNNMVSFGCIDVDINEQMKTLEETKVVGEHIYTLFPEFERVLEFSGRRGYHIWIFFKKKEPAKLVKDLILTRLRREGYNKIEVFPKQTKLTGKGFGNCIKMPMGIHKKSGKRSEILREDNGE